MKSAYITGITGQDGALLARLLLEKGYRVHGGMRRSSRAQRGRLDALGIRDDVQLHDFDLADPGVVPTAIAKTRADEFYHLAAESSVGMSWEQPVHSSDIGAMAVIRILEALRTLAPETRFYQASTCEMFGCAQEVPQRETTPLNPRSPYGAAKAFGHFMTRNYRDGLGLHASSGILFNHESPLRSSAFVTRKISLALAKLTRGGSDPCHLGNLDVRRDWGFAGDYVEGMWLMLQQQKADDYVLATGVSTSVREFVNYTAEALGMDLRWEGQGQAEQAIDSKSGKRVVEVKGSLYRPAEVEQFMGDASKAAAILGWRPKVGVQQLAGMMAKADYDALG